jgi:hypothetical protein
LSQGQFEQLHDRQANGIAASENTAGRPGLPSGGASYVMSLSSQISTKPRFFNKAPQRDQFVVR